MPGREQELADWLLQHSGGLLAEPTDAQSVTYAVKGTALIASLHFAAHVRKVVVKPMPADAIVRCPEQLFAIQERLRGRSDSVGAASVKFLGYSREQGLILMEHVDGECLEGMLRQGLKPNRGRLDDCNLAINRAAQLVARLHRLSAQALSIPYPRRPNGSFFPILKQTWLDPQIQRTLPPPFRQPECLLRWIPSSFMESCQDGVLLSDFQPKNILMVSDGIKLIDVDYTGGNPAMTTAFFLASLDRLGSAYLLRRPRRTISRWKRLFITSYCGQAADLATGLPFYYPWALLGVMQQHRRRWPWLRWHLTRYYARRLRDFLIGLDTVGITLIHADPVRLTEAF